MKRPRSLGEWQALHARIYEEKNRRDYTPEDLALRLSEEMSFIAECLRKEAYEELVERLPRFYLWFLAFCSMTSLSLEGAIWEKYHGCCPYCGALKNCFCISNETKSEHLHRAEDASKPVTLKEWQDFFFDLYGKINKLLPTVTVGLHLAEEVGEVSRAFRLQEREGEKPLHDEVADVMAWLFALSSKLSIDLEEVTWRTYPGVCDVCGKEQCECNLV